MKWFVQSSQPVETIHERSTIQAACTQTSVLLFPLQASYNSFASSEPYFHSVSPLSFICSIKKLFFKSNNVCHKGQKQGVRVLKKCYFFLHLEYVGNANGSLC